jgi:hypothetical protein
MIRGWMLGILMDPKRRGGGRRRRGSLQSVDGGFVVSAVKMWINDKKEGERDEPPSPNRV